MFVRRSCDYRADYRHCPPSRRWSRLHTLISHNEVMIMTHSEVTHAQNLEHSQVSSALTSPSRLLRYCRRQARSRLRHVSEWPPEEGFRTVSSGSMKNGFAFALRFLLRSRSMPYAAIRLTSR